MSDFRKLIICHVALLSDIKTKLNYGNRAH